MRCSRLRKVGHFNLQSTEHSLRTGFYFKILQLPETKQFDF